MARVLVDDQGSSARIYHAQPDVCDDLGVRHCNTYKFIQELDFKTGRQG